MPEQVATEGGQTTTLPAALPASPADTQPTPTEAGHPTEPEPTTAPEGEPTPAPEMISLEEANRRADRVAARTRKEIEARFDEFKREVAPQLEEAGRLRAEREQAERDQMSETQQLQAQIVERDRLLTERDARLATVEAALQEVATIRRRDQIDAAINAAAPAMLGVQRKLIHDQFDGVPDVDLGAVTQAAQAATAEVRALLETIIPSRGTQIGSPGSPPAEPQNDRDAELEDLVKRMEAGDNEAAAALQARYRS